MGIEMVSDKEFDLLSDAVEKLARAASDQHNYTPPTDNRTEAFRNKCAREIKSSIPALAKLKGLRDVKAAKLESLGKQMLIDVAEHDCQERLARRRQAAIDMACFAGSDP